MSVNNINDPFKLILISSPDGFDHEIHEVMEMFREGMEYYHIRKPEFSTHKLRQYLEKIDHKYHNRIVLHSHHELSIPFKVRGLHLTQRHRKKNFLRRWLKMKYIKLRRPEIEVTAAYHTIGAFKINDPGYSYVFLSPVFNSISKVGYKSTFNEDSLKDMLRHTSYKVIALGGVDEDKIQSARRMGFAGVALLGSVWKSKEPLEKFKRIKVLCEQKENM
jgi:thiamine-phosphate pyrophosphorylase